MNFQIPCLLLMLVSLVLGAAEPAWQSLPLQSAAQRARGGGGGEGGQWHRAMAVDASGQFLLYGTDVGGLWRSQDGGQRWEPCNVGFDPRGTSGLAIDPGNRQRCLAIGANSMAVPCHGVWLSEDGAASWRQVLPADICGSQDFRRQLAFDPASWDAQHRRTMRVYWSRIAHDAPFPGSKSVVVSKPALWRSDDGGDSWHELPQTAARAGGEVAVAPSGGVLYAVNDSGCWVSEDGGATFVQRLREPCSAVDVHPRLPRSLWVTTASSLRRSDDAGLTWSVVVDAATLPGEGPLRDARVSPCDAQRIAFWREGPDQAWPRWVTHDGGRTVSAAHVDGSLGFLPCNTRQHMPTWSPVDAQVCWSSGGDFPTLSRDGGVTFFPSSEGFHCLLVGGMMTFNAQQPDLLMIGSQDYNGAVTRDGGRTWSYTPVSGKGWGGFTYGGYALDDQVMIVGDQVSWTAPPVLTVSRDGGFSWTSTGLSYDGAKVAAGDPRDARIAFAGSLRTTDSAKTWQRMSGCTGVFAHDATGRLYGAGPGGVVASQDHGASWSVVGAVTGAISDVAVSADGDALWAVVDRRRLLRWQHGQETDITTLVPDQDRQEPQVSSVAVDPQDARVVYVARCRNRFASNASVQRSLDGGATWTSLTRSIPLRDGQRDGGREAFCVRVHPRTRDLWAAGACYGLWTLPAPLAGTAP